MLNIYKGAFLRKFWSSVASLIYLTGVSRTFLATFILTVTKSPILIPAREIGIYSLSILSL
jgi:hypothetical protein